MNTHDHIDGLSAHWDREYAAGDDAVSWNQTDPQRSLTYIRRVRSGPGMSVVDVGGGSSRLAGALLDDGHRDVAVLDLSQAALNIARERLAARSSQVTWTVADARFWRPGRHYAIWHDRAVLHFLTTPDDREQYVHTLRRVLAPGGHAIIATFAPDGPERCSGLPVQRSSPADLLALLGDGFTPVVEDREQHTTPRGSLQAFSWLVAQRSPSSTATTP